MNTLEEAESQSCGLDRGRAPLLGFLVDPSQRAPMLMAGG
jgi:hypothetical protein